VLIVPMTEVAVTDSCPNKSTALIKYVPALAGTITELAGGLILSTNNVVLT